MCIYLCSVFINTGKGVNFTCADMCVSTCVVCLLTQVKVLILPVQTCVYLLVITGVFINTGKGVNFTCADMCVSTCNYRCVY